MTLEISPAAMGQLVSAISTNAPKGSGSTHRATVLRTDNDGTTWVSIPGGADETPLHGTLVECAPGDVVDVTIANGRATATANATSPAATGRTVGAVKETAETAQLTADDAAEAAASAIEDAATARTAAASAQASAQDAETAATAAATAAGNAQVAANAATFALSDVEKVVGTLEWIAEHGEYQLTTDTAVVAGKVYYTRSGTSPNYVYTVVAEPRTADIATYYELHMDESVQNFIATHLWLDQYGLNLSVDSSNGYRIHQGTVDGTKAMGMYVLDATGDVVASFGRDGAQIGKADIVNATVSATKFTLNSGDAFKPTQFGLLNDETTGLATLQESGLATAIYVDGSIVGYGISVSATVSEIVEASIGDVPATAQVPSSSGKLIVIDGAQADDAISVTYTTSSNVGFAQFGRGTHANGSDSFAAGEMTEANGHASFAEGSHSKANGEYAHAEGNSTIADSYASHSEGGKTVAADIYAHAEGYQTEASGPYSHAQNLGTIAASSNQTAIGKYNVKNATIMYAFIIGNGTSDSNRSNALTVDWQGNIDAAGGATLGGTLESGDAITSHGSVFTKTDAIDIDGSNPSAVQYTRWFQCSDKDDDRVAVFGGARETDGRTRGFFYAYNKTSGGSLVNNHMNFYVDKSGNCTYGLSDPAAFREALRMRSGVVATRSVAAGSVTTVDVTFTPALSSAPNVVCGLQSTQTQLMGNCSCVVTATSATGFTVALVNNSSSARNLGCYWIAM